MAKKNQTNFQRTKSTPTLASKRQTRPLVYRIIKNLTDTRVIEKFFAPHWSEWYQQPLALSQTKVKIKIRRLNSATRKQEYSLVEYQIFNKRKFCRSIAGSLNFGANEAKRFKVLKEIFKIKPDLVARPLTYVKNWHTFFYEFIPGRALDSLLNQNKLTSSIIFSTAEALKKLPAPKHHWRYLSRKNSLLSFFSANLLSNKKLHPSIYPRIQNLYNQAKHCLTKTQPQPLTICHGDLAPSNIIMTGKQGIRFIDWDYAHLNEPLYDAAYFSAHLIDTLTVNNLKAKKILRWRNSFIKAYKKNRSFPHARFLAYESLFLATIVSHLVRCYGLKGVESRTKSMLKLGEENLFSL